MKRKQIVIVGVLLFLAVAGGGTLALQFDLSALPEPGALESALAAQAKRFLIARASRNGASPGSARSETSIAEGRNLFGVECSMCHGLNGRSPTDYGRWMYPRAADLGSASVQDYSDRELFWIVRNGIRLSGMPAFGKVETDEHIWQLVAYVRSLRPESQRP